MNFILPYMSSFLRNDNLLNKYFDKVSDKTNGKLGDIVEFFNSKVNKEVFIPNSDSPRYGYGLKLNLERYHGNLLSSMSSHFEYEGECKIKDGDLKVEFNSDSIIYKFFKQTKSIWNGHTVTTQELKCNFDDENLTCQEGQIEKVTKNFMSEFSNSDFFMIGGMLLVSGLSAAKLFFNHRELKSNTNLTDKQITEMQDFNKALGCTSLITLLAAGWITVARAGQLGFSW